MNTNVIWPLSCIECAVRNISHHFSEGDVPYRNMQSKYPNWENPALGGESSCSAESARVHLLSQAGNAARNVPAYCRMSDIPSDHRWHFVYHHACRVRQGHAVAEASP